MDTLQELSTTEEAARFLRLQKQTLEAWRLRGSGPTFVKLGRRVVYRREALEEFMSERERRSTSDTERQRRSKRSAGRRRHPDAISD
jgi:excisionase family DNA binding protein